MRKIAAAALAVGVLAPASATAAAPAETGATASLSHGALTLTLSYPMRCGLPGPGPLVIRLPSDFRVVSLSAAVNGRAARAGARGERVTVALPGAPARRECQTVADAVVAVRVSSVHASHAGVYSVRATVRDRAFKARLRVR